MMNARTQHHVNTKEEALDQFSFPKGFCTKTELNSQELEFLSLSQEISNNILEQDSTINEFLKYSPDALKYLFDRCLVKPVPCQMQGEVFFDLFLFKPNERGEIAISVSCRLLISLFT